jgi:hypothetical protein
MARTFDDAPSGCEFLRRLAPHVASAAGWWKATDAWIAVAISYTGLVTLGVPEKSLHSFPEAFRVGMAARADILLDHGKTPINRDHAVEFSICGNGPRQRTAGARRVANLHIALSGSALAASGPGRRAAVTALHRARSSKWQSTS